MIIIVNGHACVYEIINGQQVEQGQDLDGDDEYDRFGDSVAMNGEGKSGCRCLQQ